MLKTATSPDVLSSITPMPNVIDSLKRLERIGQEHSVTVQKLKDAAKELSLHLVKILGPEREGEEFGGDGRFYIYELRSDGLWCRNLQEYVYSSRNASFEFAGDIGKGLLDLILTQAERRQLMLEVRFNSLKYAILGVPGVRLPEELREDLKRTSLTHLGHEPTDGDRAARQEVLQMAAMYEGWPADLFLEYVTDDELRQIARFQTDKASETKSCVHFRKPGETDGEMIERLTQKLCESLERDKPSRLK